MEFFPSDETSHVLPPVLVPEPVKVNPLGLAGGEEESLFQKEPSEGKKTWRVCGVLLLLLFLCDESPNLQGKQEAGNRGKS